MKQIKDQNGIHSELTLRAFNKLLTGGIGKKHKFTVNIYNIQSSLLINGRNTSSFQDNILPNIMELMQNDHNLSRIDQNTAHLMNSFIT